MIFIQKATLIDHSKGKGRAGNCILKVFKNDENN